MNDNTARKKLKEICDGMKSSYKNSRREKNNHHKELNEALIEIDRIKNKK